VLQSQQLKHHSSTKNVAVFNVSIQIFERTESVCIDLHKRKDKSCFVVHYTPSPGCITFNAKRNMSRSASLDGDDLLTDEFKIELKSHILIPALPWFIAASVIAVVGLDNEAISDALLEILGCQVDKARMSFRSVQSVASVVYQLIQLRTHRATGMALAHTPTQHAANYSNGLDRWLNSYQCTPVCFLRMALSHLQPVKFDTVKIEIKTETTMCITK
jgi:hypothetical protein